MEEWESRWQQYCEGIVATGVWCVLLRIISHNRSHTLYAFTCRADTPALENLAPPTCRLLWGGAAAGELRLICAFSSGMISRLLTACLVDVRSPSLSH